MANKTVGVIIGRFQVASLTAGHKELIQHVMTYNAEVCILVGVSKQIDARNPLPYDCVRDNLLDYCHGPGWKNIHIHPLPDIPGDNKAWSLYVDKFVSLLFPFHDAKLYGGRDSFKQHYTGKLTPVVEFRATNEHHSGTFHRTVIANGIPGNSKAFREGVIFGVLNALQFSASDRQLQSLPLETAPSRNDLYL